MILFLLVDVCMYFHSGLLQWVFVSPQDDAVRVEQMIVGMVNTLCVNADREEDTQAMKTNPPRHCWKVLKLLCDLVKPDLISLLPLPPFLTTI